MCQPVQQYPGACAWQARGRRSGFPRTIRRGLGRFKRESDALKFVQALYKAGATDVIAPDIYASKTGNQFADCLLVKLPNIAPKRKAVRKVCSQLSKRKLGAFQPDKDIGESHLYLLLA